ncbi:SDR family oxidoreductase [Alphaproteobacteria bacterium]|nr:SDR family oxidoreductase [Alphaproteobacteria bacterium]
MFEKGTNVLVTGGAGYVGAVLIPALLDRGYNVTSLDLMIYGDEVLDKHPNLKIVSGDLRDADLLETLMTSVDLVIHLACISNDPSFELNPSLGKEINLDAFRPLVEIAKKNNVKRFIYASSSSVYGVKEESDVTEDMLLEPLTDYSKFKVACEIVLNEYQSDNFTTVTVRPATVCGYSPRQRLDVVVNILTNLAYHKRKISIFGGDQLRPNIHIKDMVRAYLAVIDAPIQKVAGEVFNAGYENHSVNELGKTVVEVIGDDVTVEHVSTDDNRSYHVSSKKIKNVLGFEPQHTIKEAVEDLRDAFEAGKLNNPLENEMYFNIKRMQSISLK